VAQFTNDTSTSNNLIKSSVFRKTLLVEKSEGLLDDQVEDGGSVITVSKPQFSYKELIMLAIFLASPIEHAVCLQDIYLTVQAWFPYFRLRNLGPTWQNSIRHNLSLNKCFSRVESSVGTLAKGGYWTFNADDKSWSVLMSHPRKWCDYKRDNPCQTTEDLLEFLRLNNQSFHTHIYTSLMIKDKPEVATFSAKADLKISVVKRIIEEENIQCTELLSEERHTNGDKPLKQEFHADVSQSDDNEIRKRLKYC